MDERKKRRGFSQRSRATSRTLLHSPLPPFLSFSLSPDIHLRFAVVLSVSRRCSRTVTKGEVKRGGTRGGRRRWMLIRCRQRRQHQKRVASGPCHQPSLFPSLSICHEEQPRLYLNALSSGYATMTRALFWNPRRPTAQRDGRRMMGIVSGILTRAEGGNIGIASANRHPLKR